MSKKITQGQMQIGKQGVTDGTITLLKNSFKTHENMKIHVLKSAGHEREKVKKIGEEIVDKLGKNYTYRVLGFSIFVKKWRKEVR